jgi:serine/threonine protein kinase
MLTTCKLGMQMLRAIEAVHELGYLHRDIKPVRLLAREYKDRRRGLPATTHADTGAHDTHTHTHSQTTPSG